jgi:hypothetical protein
VLPSHYHAQLHTDVYSHYQPDIRMIPGTAEGYAMYIVYNIYQAPPSDSLHRSNVARRHNARNYKNASQRTRRSSRLQDDLTVLGELELLGARISIHIT